MSENTEVIEEAPEHVAPAAGSWQETLVKSAALKDKATGANRRASAMLWSGAKQGITGWLEVSDEDASAESLYNEVLDLLGKSRKGDASKIRTVAQAAKRHGLDVAGYDNLAKAYGAAIAMTKTKAKHDAEDEAAESAIANITAPKSTGTAEGAALIVLSKGVDEAARLLLDALGNSEEAHRAFLRAISSEIAGRIKPPAKPKPAKKATAPKGAAAIKSAGTKPKATALKQAAKPVDEGAAKPVAKKAPVKRPAR